MKKIELLVIALLFGLGAIKANPVDANVAQKAAQNFYATTHAGTLPDLSLVYTERDASGVPVYYVFNVIAPKGFIIVSADDVAYPIIGYSNEGQFVIPGSNNNVSFWLLKRKNEIVAMRAQHIAANSGIMDEWASYTSTSKHAAPHNFSSARDSVLPLCKTYWNQSPYYNAYCPGGSVTGCVATAMAQIMKYWQYPATGMGSNCYYDDMNQGYSENYGQLCAYFDTSNYIWSKMQNTALGDSNNQIAKLMYDCGVSVNMDYTPTGSGAAVMGNGPSAFNSYTQYFSYDPNTINTAYYDNTQQADWISLLENELNNHRPMQFQGFDPNEGGHSWVCDGYSATDMMHMNWGWGGYDDGYYTVDALNPSPLDFTYNIGVVYGIEPPPGALGVNKIADNASITVYPNPGHGIFNFTLPNNNSSYQVHVYNVLGQEVNSSILNSGNSEINLSAQSKGVYIYRVMTDTGEVISTGRLVVE